MLTQATQAAIAILHDISTGIYFRSANFRFTEEEWENLFHKLEEGHIMRLLPNCEANIISSYVLCRSLNDLSLLDILEALGEPMLSTSLMLPGSEFTESDPEEIKDRLEKQVDLIIHGGYLGQKPTTVIDLTDDTPVVVREGVGDVKPFL